MYVIRSICKAIVLPRHLDWTRDVLAPLQPAVAHPSIHPSIHLDSHCAGSSLRGVMDEPLPEWELLAVFLAELRYWATRCGDSNDMAASAVQEDNTQHWTPAVAAAQRWEPYLRVLPNAPGTVLDWPAKVGWLVGWLVGWPTDGHMNATIRVNAMLRPPPLPYRQ
jgi:hypothetical protein